METPKIYLIGGIPYAIQPINKTEFQHKSPEKAFQQIMEDIMAADGEPSGCIVCQHIYDGQQVTIYPKDYEDKLGYSIRMRHCPECGEPLEEC